MQIYSSFGSRMWLKYSSLRKKNRPNDSEGIEILVKVDKHEAFIWTHPPRNPEYESGWNCNLNMSAHNIEVYGANMATQFPV